MNTKQRNFFLINFIENFFKTNTSTIFLFTHVNDLTTNEIKEFNFFFKENNIQILNIKSTLYRKMIKNLIFKNILTGPTRVLKFNNFNSFISFCQFKQFEKKLIPLLIYWNLNFYYYTFFYNYLINNLKNSNNFLEKSSQKLKSSIIFIKNVNTNIISLFNYKGLFLLLNIRLKQLK